MGDICGWCAFSPLYLQACEPCVRGSKTQHRTCFGSHWVWLVWLVLVCLGLRCLGPIINHRPAKTQGPGQGWATTPLRRGPAGPEPWTGAWSKAGETGTAALCLLMGKYMKIPVLPIHTSINTLVELNQTAMEGERERERFIKYI